MTLHDGTLLFSTDFDKLEESIKVVPGRYRDRAIQSVRSVVTNLKDYLPEIGDVSRFKSELFTFISEYLPGSEEYQLSVEDISAVEKLRQENFSSLEWIFGYSPDYEFNREIQTAQGNILINLKVKKAQILSAEIQASMLDEKIIDELSSGLCFSWHDYASILSLSEKITRQFPGFPFHKKEFAEFFF